MAVLGYFFSGAVSLFLILSCPANTIILINSLNLPCIAKINWKVSLYLMKVPQLHDATRKESLIGKICVIAWVDLERCLKI